jgi:alkylation response protein AidB-like acyl-CoA dehydrogenase
MFQLFASETAVKETEEAIRVLGGYCYARDYPVARSSVSSWRSHPGRTN